MSLEIKLREMVARAEREGQAAARRHARTLAGELATVLHQQRWGDTTMAQDKALKDAVSCAKRASRLSDAADCLSSKVLSAANGQVLDIRMPTNKELKATQELIYEKFENGEAKARGFVYVAWRKTPQRFLYVGKATNVDRLNLAAHGNLARATADATLLSLIFPSISREDYLLGVEASVIELVECLTGDLPELNTRTGAVPHSAATENLDALASFLGKVATDISRTGVWF